MPIRDLDSVRQAIASIRLEGLEISDKLKLLLDRALLEDTLTTTDIIRKIMANG